MRVVRVVSLVGCKDFSSFYWSLSLTGFTPAIAVTFCDICMPEAFCGVDTVRKKALLNLWVLWEKNLPSVKEEPTHVSRQQASGGNLTYHSPPYGGGVGGGATSPRADPSVWKRVIDGLFGAKRICKADEMGRSTYSLFTFQMVNSWTSSPVTII